MDEDIFGALGASQADPLALGVEEGSKHEALEEAVEALTAYAEVQDMVLHPGWERFLKEIHRRSLVDGKAVEDALEKAINYRTPEADREFMEAKARVKGWEYAFWLYVQIQRRSIEASKALDTERANVGDSTQNGQGAA